MRVKFNGAMETRAKGCPVCGKRKTDRTMKLTKMYYLPSGKSIMFRVGAVYEVSDSDGAFLLQYNYLAEDGTVKRVFDECIN